MIHETYAEVSCDDCGESTYVQLPRVHASYNDTSGHPDDSDDTIERILAEDHGWACAYGRHICEGCR